MFTLRNLTRYGNNYRDAVSTPPRPVTTAANAGHDRSRLQPERVPAAAHRHRSTSTATTRSRPTRPTSPPSSGPAACRTAPTSASSSPPIGSRPTRSPTLFTNGRPPVIDLVHPDPFVSYTPTYAKTGATSNADANSVALYAVRHGALQRALAGRPRPPLRPRQDRLRDRVGDRRRGQLRPHTTRRRPAAPASSTSRSRRAASTPPSAPRSRRCTTRRTA